MSERYSTFFCVSFSAVATMPIVLPGLRNGGIIISREKLLLLYLIFQLTDELTEIRTVFLNGIVIQL